MCKQVKIRETEYFYQQMADTLRAPDIFRFNLSAFTTACRTVLQYVWEEAKKNRKVGWYDKRMKSEPILVFFKKLRDENIHNCKPPNPPSNITIHVGVATISTKGEPSRPGAGAGAIQDPPGLRLTGAEKM